MNAAGVPRHPTITGERTSLRAASDRDLDLLAGWFAPPEVYRWWGGKPLSRQDVAAKYTGSRSPEMESFVVESGGSSIGYLQLDTKREVRWPRHVLGARSAGPWSGDQMQRGRQ
jgi:hypothetical protein